MPACRTLDCITVLSKSLVDAEKVDSIAKGFDPRDPYSRSPVKPAECSHRRIGVLPEDELEFFGDAEYAHLYAAAVERISRLGWSISRSIISRSGKRQIFSTADLGLLSDIGRPGLSWKPDRIWCIRWFELSF